MTCTKNSFAVLGIDEDDGSVETGCTTTVASTKKEYPTLDLCVEHVQEILKENQERLPPKFDIEDIQDLPEMLYRKIVIARALQQMISANQIVRHGSGYCKFSFAVAPRVFNLAPLFKNQEE
jgi:hypothetical protein